MSGKVVRIQEGFKVIHTYPDISDMENERRKLKIAKEIYEILSKKQ